MEKEDPKKFQQDQLPPDESGDKASEQKDVKPNGDVIPDKLTHVKNASASGLGSMGRTDEAEE